MLAVVVLAQRGDVRLDRVHHLLSTKKSSVDTLKHKFDKSSSIKRKNVFHRKIPVSECISHLRVETSMPQVKFKANPYFSKHFSPVSDVGDVEHLLHDIICELVLHHREQRRARAAN